MSTVLIIQSDAVLNGEWCSTLESSGHAVLASKGGIEGIKRVREGGIDVVVVDLYDSGGLTDFVAELANVPDPPPFVMVSGSPKAPEESARYGAAAFLPKPCNQMDLDETVHRLTSGPMSDPYLQSFEDEPAEPMEVDDEPTRPRPRTPR